MTNRILRLPEVMNYTGLARSTIYLRISEDNFPKPIPLGGKAVGWLVREIDEWIERQMKSRESS